MAMTKNPSTDQRQTSTARRGFSFWALAYRFLRDHRGATAVELALVLPVFLYLLIGIVEMSLMFYARTMVDGAVLEAGRQIRTGQAQLSGDTLTTFTTQLCNSLYGAYDCGNISIDVRTFSSFSSVSIPIELDDDGVPITQFSAGGSGEITAVRAIYNWTFFTPMIGILFGTTDTTIQLTMTTVFQNEPYE